MKKTYEKPQAEVIVFEIEDKITAIGDGGNTSIEVDPGYGWD